MAKRKRSRAKTPKQSKSKATTPVADEKPISADVTPDQDDVLYKLLDAKIEIPIEVLRNKQDKREIFEYAAGGFKDFTRFGLKRLLKS